MHWTPDRAGRFVKRPHYSTGELDQLAEQLTTLLTSRRGRMAIPITTADLIVLVEYLGATLDLSAELSADERVIHGCTEFIPGHRPLVRIARRLSAHPRHEHRLRTTLAHACGHVWLHRPVAEARSGLGPLVEGGSPVIYRGAPTMMLRAPSANWAEWQAGYVSGALLMPVSVLSAVVQRVLTCEQPLRGPLLVRSPAGQRLVLGVMAAFAVSEKAARVRFLQRGVLTEEPVVQGQLFE
jgi:hypothetical protein